MNPRFSIIVPVYNVEKYLDQCVTSILNQTFHDYEVILVDDGSTDSSGIICDNYSNSFNNVKTIHSVNRGEYIARKEGINNSIGEYCIFIDSDDYVDNNMLTMLKDVIDEEGCDCVIYGFDRINDSGNVISVCVDSEYCILNERRDILMRCLTVENYNSLCRKAVKRDLLLDWKDQEIRTRIGADLLGSLSIYRKAEKIVFLPQALYHYRYNLNSVTNQPRRDNYWLDTIPRTEALKMIQDLDCLTQEDLTIYHSFCLTLLCKQIRYIARLNISNGEKEELLREVMSTDYYKSFLSKDIQFKNMIFNNRLILWLFSKGHLKILVRLFSINDWNKNR